MELVFILALVILFVEHHLPFRGFLSGELSDSIKEVGFRHYMLAWLPTWWITLGFSFVSIGVSVGCSIWAIVDQFQGQSVWVPVLVSLITLPVGILTAMTPIVLAWLKDRSETRQLDHLKHRIEELQAQISANQQGHADNAVNIQKIADAAQKILEVKEQGKSTPPE